MALPWVRLDANIAHHDKIVALMAEARGVEAAWLYICALGWSGGQGTDGWVPSQVLRLIWGDLELGQLLVKHNLFDQIEGGYLIHNFDQRQMLNGTTQEQKKAQVIGGIKGACILHHGPDCGCWKKRARKLNA